MSEQDDSAPKPVAACANAGCGRAHYGFVAWCPFCGTRQSHVRAEAAGAAAAIASPLPSASASAASSKAAASTSASAGQAPAAAAPAAPDPIVSSPRGAAEAVAPAPVESPRVRRPAAVAEAAQAPAAPPPSPPSPPPAPKWGRRAVGAALGIAALWWAGRALVGTSPNECEPLLDAAGGLQQAGDPRGAQAKVNLALNACRGAPLDRARALNRTLQPVITAIEACDRVKRQAEEQVQTGQLRQASRLVIATPTACASRPDIVALRQSIETARRNAAEAVAKARAQVSGGAVDDARASLETASRLDRDNLDVARVSKTVDAKARELAIREALASSQPGAMPSTVPPVQTAPSPRVATTVYPPTSAETTTAITQMMSLAMNSNWSRLDAQVQALKSSASSPPPGDRRASRAANLEGLRLLRAGNAAAAVPVLLNGTQADPSDVEVLNNLGFAQMQAGQLQDASATLERAILSAPDRTSAWANYAETLALGGNEPGALAGMVIAVHYSNDRQKSIDALAKLRETHPNAVYVRVLGKVLAEMSAIPRSPNDRSSGLAAPTAGTVTAAPRTANAPTAAPPTAAPLTARTSTPSAGPLATGTSNATPPAAPPVAATAPTDAKRIECEVLVRAGRQALATRSYDVAMQQAGDALAAFSGCPGAQELAATARQTKDAARAGLVLR